MKNLEQKYEHKQVEQGKYQSWVASGYFTAGDVSKKPYSIVIPPPNVTGKLHLGHAWDTTMQDIEIRYKRLNGYDALFLPGMDHAGIATQAVVAKKLREQGISPHEIGRDAFIDKTWEWKETYAQTIREQWAKMGLSLDYSRERFTLDDGLSEAVTKVFVDLYNDGLIYQGYRIINWDVEAQTALSNIEVIHKEVEGAMYTFEYTVEGTNQPLHVATTRPETMFGDVCIVVHPEDPRYQDVIGKRALNPANGAWLPIIADDYIDIEFGTGVMKCTPAHDPNDYEIGMRHHLEMPICMNPNGTMNELAGDLEGVERFEARRLLVEKIKADGKFVSKETHMHQVGHSERTDVIVEPYLSKQWFVSMKPLAEAVIKAQASEEPIHFYPPRFEHTFNQWLENIEDWTISRQLWWGHRIPAWFHKETEAVYVGIEAPKDIENWTQDEDVLDTWFSSALWPFSTLGWPEETEDFERFYPTSTLVTGYDIIFFWVARMAFQARYFTNQRPFKDVLIHGLIRDKDGIKMSKSLGNGVDPMDVIETYGVDALRYFLTTNSTPGQDMRYIEEKVESSWNFINKVWNASRFVLMHVDAPITTLDTTLLDQKDRYILNKFNETLDEVNRNMEKYEYAIVGNVLTRFVWDDFCSWYIEMSKTGLQSDQPEGTRMVLGWMLEQIVILLHPFMPFVTEEIYQHLPGTKTSIHEATWPTKVAIETTDLHEVELLIHTIETVRELRSEYDIKPSKRLKIELQDAQNQPITLSQDMKQMLENLGKLDQTVIDTEPMKKPIQGATLLFDPSELVDKEALLEKLTKERDHLIQEIKRAEGMLANQNFIAKAPEAKVAQEQAKLDEYRRQLDIVEAQLVA